MKKVDFRLIITIIILSSLTSCTDKLETRIPGYLLDVDLSYNNSDGLLPEMADPYILEHNGKYYLYGTDDIYETAQDGIKVYVSTDLIKWTSARGANLDGRALVFGDSWYKSDHPFTCPEVYYKNGYFYMFYVVDTRIAVAKSTSPLGPFIQEVKKPLTTFDAIDPHLFIDDDGKSYLYFVAFDNLCNEIYVAELTDDWSALKTEKIRCLSYLKNPQPWEQSDLAYIASNGAPIIEAPTVLKHKGLYYLTYTANNFISGNHYAVGYATATSPTGEWTKYEGNPILAPTAKIKGTGHNGFAVAPNNDLYIVYHTHKDTHTVGPRKLAIDRCEFIPNSQVTEPDILKVYVTDTTQLVGWKRQW